ncbi:phosphate signaling complex protein PhoU [Phycicoccus sp. MAQZ13P-2]|uniref:phosphate signaling complex protein PhoU n=1 Tax=Phycicoccus TaxID=367298 RepID=UPI0004C3F4DC|nr:MULTISPECIES: phosphate signaling complex protein PhoU [Phycicoccus]MBT9254901.1 phosphate signaling complex protein PhoU [Phycicoccus mangrovi]MBT9256100.1 phosphate signaling complex protein PhoU [Phycicoccus mangrovi]MBT9273885.1 phosphate signaling complex protein PhoU [Phycicoccus mangrovi]GIL36794.1 phosphate transport system regulatory protein PhoU [Phycicoccus sp. DTK01]
MRKAYHEELDRIAESLVEMTHLAASAMSRATTALLDADVSLADSVIAADAEIDRMREQVDLLSFDLIALQQPVATDLRVVVTSMRMSSDIERMGDLARHVAKVARLRYPASAVPPELRGTFREMGTVAELVVEKAGSVIAARDVDAARDVAREDDAMDRLHRDLFTHVTGGDWAHDTETAVDVVLLGRYYERFADHAVSVAERVIWIVTGEWGDEAAGGHDEVGEHTVA